ncbi:MAG TPA: hypothetical protein VN176_07420 [Verrucomicrobiae bacterium]|jgi:hypothetical protein|nr:hypothetical protein [Verrucomicrobiae bacterium]
MTRHDATSLFIRTPALIAFLLMVAACWQPAFAQTMVAMPLNNADIIRLTRSGLSDIEVVQAMESGAVNFDVSPDALIALKKAGVGQRVLLAMLDNKRSNGRAAQLIRPPGGDLPADKIDELARLVLHGGPGSHAALVVAFENAGFPIHNDNGTLTGLAGEGQGLTIDSWEVEALAHGSRPSLLIPLSSLSKVLGEALPPLAKSPVDQLLLGGIRASAQGNKPALHFWGQFIVALGRHSPEPYDLLQEVPPPAAKVLFDKIQTAFILRRFIGDAAVVLHRYEQRTGTARPNSFDIMPQAPKARAGGRFVDAAFPVPPHSSSPAPAPTSPAMFSLCDLSDLQNLIMDYGSSALSTGFEALMNALESSVNEAANAAVEAGKPESGVWGVQGMEAVGKIGIVQAVLGIVLEYLKLAEVYLGLNVTFELEPDPLIRTRTTEPGRNADLKATAVLNVPDMSALNCTGIRLMYGAVGFDIPNFYDPGAMKNSGMWWSVIDGPIQFLGETSTLSKPTNEEGETTVVIQGKAQKYNLPDWVSPFSRNGEVQVTVQVEKPSMSNDLKDAITGAAGDWWVNLIKMPAQLIERTEVLMPHFNHRFEVIDWKLDLELSIDSWIFDEEVGLVQHGRHADAVVPIELRPDIAPNRPVLWGEAPLNLFIANWQLDIASPCPCQRKFDYDENAKITVLADSSNIKMAQADVLYVYIAAREYELQRETCECPRPAGTITNHAGRTPSWAEGFRELHLDDMYHGALRITDWDAVPESESSSVVGQKVYAERKACSEMPGMGWPPGSDCNVYEVTVIQLRKRSDTESSDSPSAP